MVTRVNNIYILIFTRGETSTRYPMQRVGGSHCLHCASQLCGCVVYNNIPMAQRIRRETTNLEIAGSNPAGNVYKKYILSLYNNIASGGIRTHASEDTWTWVKRLRPLGHECVYSRVARRCAYILLVVNNLFYLPSYTATSLATRDRHASVFILCANKIISSTRIAYGYRFRDGVDWTRRR